MTFIECFWLCDEYNLNHKRACAHVLEVANIPFEADLVFQADEFVKNGLTVLNVFHAATAATSNDRIISSDNAFDQSDIERIRLEPDAAD